MSEYDYSGLYHQNPQNTPPTGGQTPPRNPADSGYPNVGSSGMNTANTAQTDFASDGQGGQPAGEAYAGYTAPTVNPTATPAVLPAPTVR